MMRREPYEIWGWKELELYTTFGLTSLKRLIRDGGFPAPYRQGRVVRSIVNIWHKDQIEMWIRDNKNLVNYLPRKSKKTDRARVETC